MIRHYVERFLAAPSQGHLGFVGLAKEDSWGEAMAALNYVEAMDESLTLMTDRFATRNIYNGFYEPDDMAGVNHVSGGIRMAANPLALGHLLKAAMFSTAGSVTVVASGFLYRTHFISTQSEYADGVPSQPYTLEVFRDVSSSHQYAGAILDKMTLEVAPNQPLMLNTQWLAKSRALIAHSTPTFPGSPTDPFAFDTASLAIAGTATARWEAFMVSIDNQVDGIYALNASKNLARIRRKGPQLVRVAGTLDFTDVTEQEDFIHQTERRFKLTLTRGNSFELTIDMPRVVYTAFGGNISGTGRLTAQMEGFARYSPGSALAVDFGLTATDPEMLGMVYVNQGYVATDYVTNE